MENKINKLSNLTRFDLIIKGIPKEQIEILKLIWDYFLKYKKWPLGKSFRKEQGRLNIEKVIANLEPIFIWHMKNNPQEDYYRITTEGVYAIEGYKGPHIKLLFSYLDYLRK